MIIWKPEPVRRAYVNAYADLQVLKLKVAVVLVVLNVLVRL